MNDNLLLYDLYYILRNFKPNSQGVNAPSQELGRPISGTVTGLISIGLRLRNVDGTEITLSPGQTSFQLTNTQKGNYLVSIQRQPLIQSCTLTNQSGNSESAVTNLIVNCSGIGVAGIGLWDTGLSDCYTNSNSISVQCPNPLFPRQDGDINPISARSFTVLGDGNIKDNISGLIWRPCIEGWSGANCFTGVASTSNFATAQSKCGPLPWRVPSAKELMSIIDFTNPSYGVVSVFPNHPGGFFLWSNEDFGSQSLVLNINTGAIDLLSKLNTAVGYVQCVNDSEVVSVPVNFTDLGNGIIRDEVNGLEWEKCIAGLSGANCSVGTPTYVTWQAGLAYCANLNLGGYSDWRMPNINELSSIVDFSRFSLSTTIDPIFTGSPRDKYHSSTTIGNGNQYSGQWINSVGNFPYYPGNYQTSNQKGTSYLTRCVRGPSVP
ncbi:DUF1566 domain-containing protein (plasmid) [Leptospira sp. WS60.C2]